MDKLKERKQLRLTSGLADTLSPRMYNLVIGACIAYGFIINAIIVGTCSDYFTAMNTTVFIIGYLVSAIIGIILTTSDKPLISFIGYNFVVLPLGALLSICLPTHNTIHVFQAIVITAIIFIVMTCLATAFPNIFAKLGRGLFISLVVLIVVELISVFIFGFFGTIFNWISAAIFTLYIGYDWHVAQSFPKTLDNAIDSACDLYIDLINLVIDILHIIDR